MALAPGSYELGPSNGSLHLLTTREGMAAKVGHDLRIRVARWSGTAHVPDPDDLSTASLSVLVEMDSLEVKSGTGGASPLDDGDKADIARTAAKALDVAHHPTTEFSSTAVRPAENGGEIEGTLKLAGAAGTLTLAVTSKNGSSWTASGTVVQTEYGVKPYKAFMGALRLSDPVTVEAEISLQSS
jgi:polyisoprenoid-binding protein YceI